MKRDNLKYFSIKDIVLLPNILTVSRLGISIPFYFLLSRHEKFSRLWIFIPAGLMILTDLLDGYVARRTGKITNTGKILDAVIDKVIIDVCAVILVLRGEIHFLLFLPLLLRDISLGLMGILLLSNGVEKFRTHITGRLTPLTWALGMAVVVAGLKNVAMMILVLGDVLALVSGFIYIKNGLNIRGRSKR